MKRTSLALAFLALLTLLSSPPATAQGGPHRGLPLERASFQRSKSEPAFAPGRVLVRFRKGRTAAAMAAAHAAVRAQVIRSYRVVGGLQLVRLAAGMSVAQAVRLYRRNPDVLYAEPDYLQYADATPNDPSYGQLWGMNNTGQSVNGGAGGTVDADIDAPEAWNLSTGSATVVVGVIDSGADYNHPDLAANTYSNAAECSGAPGVDDDGNGYVDDCHGINPAYSTTDPMDDNDHGTHVAGTIGAVGNNGVGVVGVNWHVRIYPCKFLNAGGSGPTSGAVECLEYFAMMKDRGVNIVATNNSWGGGGYSQALYDAIAAQLSRGILFVAAAGNNASDNDAAPHYPSNYFLPNVISVAATDRWDALASFSDFGRNTVQMGAPGATILSTIPTADGSYAYFSGTSMATPHVTGVIALLKAQNPFRTWIDLRNLILAGGDPKPALSETVTGRRLNAYGAMTCASAAVHSRLQPAGPLVTAAVGVDVLLAELAINCASPDGGGGITVDLDPGGGSLPLLDDGAAPDQAAGDGIFTADTVLNANGIFTLTFPGGDAVTAEVLVPYAAPTLPAFSYRTISGTDLDLGDDTAANIISPFAVRFGQGSFFNLHVGSNGVIELVTSTNSPANDTLPSGVNAVIAPWWDDLMPQSGDPSHNVYWAVTGSAPHRELVVEWRAVPHYETSVSAAANVTFEVVFFEDSSDLLFLYKDATFGSVSADHDQGKTASVGVQIASGSAVQYSYYTASLSDSLALLWHLSGDPVPGLFSISPSHATQGGEAFTLILDGTGFASDSVVRWGGAARITHYVSDTQLTADIPASDLALGGPVNVTVLNPAPGGGESSPAVFTVDNPVPMLSEIGPSSAAGGSGAFTLTLYGTGFVGSSVVRFNGSNIPTHYTSATQLTADVSADWMGIANSIPVTVFNPAPGGGVSNALTFTVTSNPVPNLLSLTPWHTAAGGPAFTLHIYGKYFAPGAVVKWNGSSRTYSMTNIVALEADIPASDLITPGSATVTVTNPVPGGGESASLTFTIDNAVPGAGTLHPSSVAAGHAQFPLTIHGTGFNTTSVVRWNGSDRATTFVSGTQLRATILAPDLAGEGTADVAVSNPGSGGGESSALTFTMHSWRSANDFDGDAKADILWQNSSTHDVAVWLMDGASKTSAAIVASGVDANWKAVGVGDFDGDGKADILWQNSSTGGVVVWLMNGASKSSAAFVATGVDPNWKIVGVGDFDGDGMADILWQNPATGGVVVWLMNGASRTSAAFVATGVDPNWKAVGVGDFDGDGMADILWQHSSTHDVAVWLMDGATRTSSAFVATGVDPSWKVVGVGDFDADSKADILWQNSATGGVVVWLMDGAAKSSAAFVATGVLPAWKAVAVADFDSDHKADILWQNYSTGDVVVWLMDGAAKTSGAFVASGVDPAWKVVSVYP